MQAILIAEDDAAARQILQDALSETDGWVVTAVDNGARLLEALTTVNPSLIVLDVNMPGLSGLEVYRLLREHSRGATVPVLFVTANPNQVREARLEGPYHWLAKPFDLDDLITRAARLMGQVPET